MDGAVKGLRELEQRMGREVGSRGEAGTHVAPADADNPGVSSPDCGLFTSSVLLTTMPPAPSTQQAQKTHFEYINREIKDEGQI